MLDLDNDPNQSNDNLRFDLFEQKEEVPKGPTDNRPIITKIGEDVFGITVDGQEVHYSAKLVHCIRRGVAVVATVAVICVAGFFFVVRPLHARSKDKALANRIQAVRLVNVEGDDVCYQYEVSPGEDMHSIADRYGKYWGSVWRDNRGRIPNHDHIEPGDVLELWVTPEALLKNGKVPTYRDATEEEQMRQYIDCFLAQTQDPVAKETIVTMLEAAITHKGHWDFTDPSQTAMDGPGSKYYQELARIVLAIEADWLQSFMPYADFLPLEMHDGGFVEAQAVNSDYTMK